MVSRAQTKDRREYPRYRVGMRLQIRRQNPPEGFGADAHEGWIIDLSNSGVRFGAFEFFHRRENLEVTVLSSDGEAELRCEVEVLRSTRADRHCETAAKVTRLLPLEVLQATPRGESAH